ncbi:hypothetical protein V3C99_008782 [Haemonchus contortus]
MTIAFITGLLLILTVNAEDNSAAYSTCKNNVTYPKKGTDLPNWCRTMRIDVGSCLSEKLNIQDNGSIASRGNVLLKAFQRNPDANVLKDVKLYHYGCLYNSWSDFIDDHCFQTMIIDCVNGNKSCYYNACPSYGLYKRGQWQSLSSPENISYIPVTNIVLELISIVFSINLAI